MFVAIMAALIIPGSGGRSIEAKILAEYDSDLARVGAR